MVGISLQMPSYPAFAIGDDVLVSGIVYVNEEWNPVRRGKVQGIALELLPDATVHIQYHVALSDGTHCYSHKEQLELAPDIEIV